MALWALLSGLIAAAVAFAIGTVVSVGVGASAAIGVMAAVGGLARQVSPVAVQAVALTSFIVLIGVVAGVYAALNATASWFSAKAFGGGLLALIPVAFYEAYLARRGRIAELIVDADRAAAKRPEGSA
jgi:hypothetical protein